MSPRTSANALTARTLLLAAVAVAEAGVLVTYVLRGTTWQWLVHSLLGAAIGLAVAAVAAGARGSDVPALPAALAGQLVALAPDIALHLLGRPHGAWADLFLGHLAVHRVPAPLLLTLGAFVVAGWAWWLAGPMRLRRAGLLLAITVLAVLATVLGQAPGLPAQLAVVGG